MEATMKMTLETARALQEQKRRRQERQELEQRERRNNSPAEKSKRETKQADRDESLRLYMASSKAESADDEEPPLHEVVLEHVDVRDPKFAKLRARLVITVKRIIAEREYAATYRFNRNDPELAQELTRAREVLALLEGRADPPS
jgi:hypothetical protein